MGAVAREMEAKLRAGLSPSRLEIVDDSHRHAGHSGAKAGGESHFSITVQSEVFAGLTRVQRQRTIHQLLADELAGGVHALSVRALAPGEG
ncbi:MAG: BolA family protein [Caulobacteraceae bacterium]